MVRLWFWRGLLSAPVVTRIGPVAGDVPVNSLSNFFLETVALNDKSPVVQSAPGSGSMSLAPWMHGLPLRAVLTRPQDRQTELVNHLQACGWETLCVPALELCSLDGQHLMPQDLPQAHDWVMFVSRTAWQTYWGLAGKRWSPDTRIAVVGIATAQAIRRDLGAINIEILTPLPPGQQDSEALWGLLKPRLAPGARVLIVAGKEGRTWLLEQLLAASVQARILEVYARRPAALDQQSIHVLNRWSSQLHPGHCGVWLMTSHHGIQALQETLSRQSLLENFSPAAVIVTHHRLESRARLFLGQSSAMKDAPVLVTGPDAGSIMQAFDAIKAVIGDSCP